MSQPSTRQLLHRLAIAFALSFVFLTGLLLTNYGVRQLPQLRERGFSAEAILEILLLAVPFTAAMTIPMAVFVAVLWLFTRLGADGTLSAARRQPDGIRRLLMPILGAATVVAVLAFASNVHVLPRANARLAAVLERGATARSDRMMTIGELRAAAREARTDSGPEAVARAATYEVEIQKKYALAAACVVLALSGAALGLLFPSGGVALVIIASLAVFGGYYVSLIGGEALADQQLLSPIVAMWMGNAFLLAAALSVVWIRRGPQATSGAGSLAVGR